MAGPAPAPARRWRNAPIVRERDSRRARWLWAVFLGLCAAATPIAAYLLQQMEYVQVRYQIEELRDRRARMEEAVKRLRIERATLEAFPRVESRAVEDLGLVHPPPRQVVVVRQVTQGRGRSSPRAPDAARAAR